MELISDINRIFYYYDEFNTKLYGALSRRADSETDDLNVRSRLNEM